MGKISSAEVLRLRATSAVSRSQSVRRSTQDDDSVGELTERRPLCGSRGAPQIGCARDDKWRVVTFIRGRQVGWTEKNQQVPPLRCAPVPRQARGRRDDNFVQTLTLPAKIQ